MSKIDWEKVIKENEEILASHKRQSLTNTQKWEKWLKANESKSVKEGKNETVKA